MSEEDQLSENTLFYIDRDDATEDNVAEDSDHTDLAKLGASQTLKFISSPDSAVQSSSRHESKANEGPSSHESKANEGPSGHESKFSKGPSSHEFKVNDEI